MSFLIHERIVREASQYIDDHLHLSLSVSELANHFGYNRKQFTRIFKEVTGIFPSVYIKSVKVEQAKKLLQDSEVSIMEIADMLGYEYQNHFSRMFQNEVGMKPIIYRKMCQKNPNW